LTSRGWWFLFIVLVQISLGLILSDRVGPVLALIGFGLLAWFGTEWLLFRVRVQFALPQVKFRRRLFSGKRETPILWAGQDFEVRVEIVLNSRLSLSYITLQDRPPSGCDRVDGVDDIVTSLSATDVAAIEYTLRCLVPGEIRFEGVRIQVADLQGFFYQRSFRRQKASYLVLPPLADAEGNRRTTKSHNILPPPGLHRLRQTGGGGELHDLRDYRPGDPPKMIAWKTSARRDRLIIKEFESDVPVRCTLFVDVSSSVRIGPPRDTMLSQITTISSGIAQAALSDRDHVGLVLVDEKQTEMLAPARTSRHLIDLLHRLARANGSPPISPVGDIAALVKLANPLAHEIYPDLMNRRINRIPFRMFWEPILDSRHAWLVLIPLLPLALAFGWFATYFLSYITDFREGTDWSRDVGGEAYALMGGLLVPLLISAALALFSLLVWLVFGMSGQFPPWYTLRMRRKRLASLFAVLDESPLGTDARYLDDDAFFVKRIQLFLAEHHRRYPVALFDEHGRYLFRSEAKVETLTRALLHSVARGRDNELFVLLFDLFELENNLDGLLRAVRVARARHHQVVVISPWLPGIPVLDEKLDAAERTKEIRRIAVSVGFRGVETQLFLQTAERYHRAFTTLRREFGRSGVMLVRAQEHESVRMILNRMDRLRGVRARR